MSRPFFPSLFLPYLPLGESIGLFCPSSSSFFCFTPTPKCGWSPPPPPPPPPSRRFENGCTIRFGRRNTTKTPTKRDEKSRSSSRFFRCVFIKSRRRRRRRRRRRKGSLSFLFKKVGFDSRERERERERKKDRKKKEQKKKREECVSKISKNTDLK